MRRLRKYLLAGSLAVIILVVVSIGLILASRWLTGSGAVREKIVSETARLTGGQLHYEKLALHLLPRPHLTASQIGFRIPDKVSLETASLAVYPDLMALLRGSVELEGLVIDRPSTRVNLPVPSVRKSGSSPKNNPSNGFQETAATVFGALARLGPDLEITVQDGTFGLLRPEKAELIVDKIGMQLSRRGDIVTLDLRGRSEMSGPVTFKGSVNLATRSSDGRLRVDGLNARALLAELPPLPGIVLSDTSLELDVAFNAQAADRVSASAAVKVPTVEIIRQNRRIALKEIDFQGDIVADARKLDWKVKSLKINSHGLDLGGSGTLVFGGPATPAALELDAVGKRIDVAAVGQGFTDLAGDVAWVQSAFGVAREGMLEKATCHLVARKTGGRWMVPELKAAGSLTSGLISIPGADLDLEAVSGEVVLDNQQVDFKQMQGRLSFGTFDKLDARIDWRQTATLKIFSPRGTLVLEQFYPWLTAFEGLHDLRKFVQTADGELNLTKLELSGPLASPATWEIGVAADLEDVTLTSPELNGPLHLVRGEVSFKPQTFSLEKIHLQYLDADVYTSCTIRGNPGRPGQMNLALDGTIGEQTLVWIRRFKDLPERLRIRPPLKISGMKLHWDDRSNVALVGKIATAGGTRVVADVAFTPRRWQINRFELNDGISDVTLKLTKSAQRIDLDYSGKLRKATLDRALKENKILKGWVAGTLKAVLDLKNPRSSTITGAIQGEGLVLFGLPVSPIEFERFSVECRGKDARIESTDLIVAGAPMRLKGTAGITEQAYIFDLELDAESLNAEAFNKIQKEQPSRPAEPKDQKEEKLPINGVIRFKTPHFILGDYTWSPLHADIAIKPDTVKITATRADLCGISTPGTVTITDQGLDLAFKPAATDQNLQQTWKCLQAKPLHADSLFNLVGTIEAHGAAQDLIKSLQGDIRFTSDNGMIHYSNILTKIFSFLSLSEVFAGKASNWREKEFGYDTIRAHAAIEAGALNFDEILVDGHSMKISGAGTVNLETKAVDVTLLVAPLKTFDRIVKSMPVIGYITDGSVLSVPVRIKGGIANPEVVPMSPAAVGRGLVGLLERTLKAPLKVVEALPGANVKDNAPADIDAGKSESQPK